MFFELLLSILGGSMVCIANRKSINAQLVLLSFLAFLIIFVTGFFGNWFKVTLLITMAFYYVCKFFYAEAAGALIFILIGVFLLAILTASPGTITVEDPYEYRNESLEVLRIGSSAQGHFFLGTGSVNSNEYYVYNYVRNSELLREKVPITRNVHIFINDTVEKPFVRYYTIHQNEELSGIAEFLYGKNHRSQSDRIDFFIPSKSLVQGVYI